MKSHLYADTIRQGGGFMYWLMRPAIGWGCFIAVHAIGIPLVYMLGKSCEKRKLQRKCHLNEIKPRETANEF